MSQEQITQIHDALEKQTVLIGAKRTVKLLRAQKVSKVFLSKNVADHYKSDIEYYAKLQDIPVEQTDISNSELSVICKKPFTINVLAILK